MSSAPCGRRPVPRAARQGCRLRPASPPRPQ
jgi:hypothetical protein